MDRCVVPTRAQWTARLVGGLVAAALLVACGSDEPVDEPSAPATSETTTSEEPTSPSASATPPPPVTGIVLARCEESAIALSMLDPASAAEQAIGEFTFAGDPTFGCTRLRDYPSLVLQAMFDPSFGRLAISVEGEGDGSSHVGWQTADGAVFDVSAAIAEATGEPASEARHVNPLFGSDGAFLYVDEATDELVSYAVSTDGELAETATRTAVGGTSSRLLMTPWGALWEDFKSEPGPSICLTYPGPGGLFAASATEASPQIWIDDESFLQLEPDPANTITFDVGRERPEGSPGFCPSPGVPLFPGGEAEVRSPVVSPDGLQLAFMTQVGTALALSTGPLLSGTPTQIGPIEGSPTAAFLVAWRP